MEQLLIEVAKQVPALLVLVYLVTRFLAALKERDEGFRQILSETIATQKETNQMLGRVGQALDQQTEDASRTRKVLHDTQEALASANRG
jgi:ABC-type transporter Mla subunit MlaD